MTTTDFVEAAIKPSAIPTTDVSLFSANRSVGINANELYSRISEAAFGVLRYDCKWENVETALGVYNFTEVDSIVNLSRAQGLVVQLIFGYGDVLYTATNKSPARTAPQLTAWRNFITAAVTRYAAFDDVHYEVYNEPDNNPYWDSAPNASEYATLLSNAVTAIRAVKPNAIIISGGLSKPNASNVAYANTVYASGALASVNGFGMHFYQGAISSELVWRDIARVKAQAASFGLPTYATEWGYSGTDMSNDYTAGGTQSQLRQASKLVRMTITGWVFDLPLNVVYNIRNTGASLTDKESNFGIFHWNSTEKTAYGALKYLLNLAKNNTVTKLPPTASGSIPSLGRMVINRATDSVTAVWAIEKFTPTVIRVPLGLVVHDMVGAVATPMATSDANYYQISQDSGPLYIYSTRAQAETL